MIEVKNLTVQYDGIPVLQDMTMQFEQGLVHGIAGLNGAGKTTFFNVLAGVQRPSSGIVLRRGIPPRRNELLYLETTNFFYTGITGREYLNIFRKSNMAFDLAVLQEYFKLPLDMLITQYSTGMRKKLAVLAILQQDAPVLVLDEPFNGLDMETNKIMEVIIDTLRQKDKTVFVSSHIIAPLLNVCNCIHLLQGGVFAKTFMPPEFDDIDGLLFGELKARAAASIAGAI